MIFVPGNAGSYMQVRSVASSSSRQYHRHPDGVAADMAGLKKRDFFTGQCSATTILLVLMSLARSRLQRGVLRI